MTPLVVTGVGAVSALGTGKAALFEGLRSGAATRPSGGQLEVPSFDPTRSLGDKGLRSLDRLTKLLLVATREALHDAGLKSEGKWSTRAAEDVGLVVSCAYGSLEATVEIDRVATLEDARYINPSRFPLTVSNTAAGYAAIWEEIRALNVTVCDGNCGGLDAVGCAELHAGQRRARALVVGGVESNAEAIVLAFDKLGLARDGVVPGEGAAVFVAEPAADAAERGATGLAEIVGYGARFEPPPSDAALVHPSAGAAQGAIEAALADAGIVAGAVDAVVSGVSGLRAFDEAELVAIGKVTPGAPVFAPKRLLGETFGAGGAFGVLAGLALLRGELAESARAGQAGAPVRGGLRAPARTVLVTALGYYGNASALVIRAPSR